MPLYEYVCGSCKKKTEVIQRVNEAPLKVCPHCGGKLKKAISAPAIQFKGSGFYITDYPKGEKGTAPKSDGGKADREAKADKPAASTEGASKTEKSSGTEAAASTSTTSTAPASTTAASSTSTSAASSKD